MEMFRDLISQGALEPVAAMEGEDPFAGKKPDMEGDPFAKAAHKLEAHEAAQGDAKQAAETKQAADKSAAGAASDAAVKEKSNT